MRPLPGQQVSARTPGKAAVPATVVEPLRRSVGCTTRAAGTVCEPVEPAQPLAAVRRARASRSSEERTVTLTSDELWSVPYIYMTATATHFDDELRILAYLSQGVPPRMTIWHDSSIRREFCTALPPERPDVPPITRSITSRTTFRRIPKIHEHDGAGAGLGLSERSLVVYYSYQSDLGDG
jgi:hypothetical protein